MKHLMVGALLCLSSTVGAGWTSSAVADDRELQAILARQGCVPARIAVTELSVVVTAYEVTCRGSGRVLTVVCADSDCRLQPKAREDDDR